MITILLATYNGQKYLPQLLDSIAAQTYTDWQILAQDDLSGDSTLQVLQDFAALHPDKMIVLPNAKRHGSAQSNFFDMMLHVCPDCSDGQYFMLCDQDDVWLPEKLELTLAEMKRQEQLFPDTPVLVHTDLRVVDNELCELCPSFMTMQNLDSKRRELRHLLIQNIVTGCTAMFNAELAQLITVPQNNIIHDWWLAMLAAAVGVISYVPQPTILYRQHSSNCIGAQDVRSLSYTIKRIPKLRETKGMIHETYTYAAELLELYSESLTKEKAALLKEYSEIASMRCKLSRIARICRLGVWQNGLVRNIGQLLLA